MTFISIISRFFLLIPIYGAAANAATVSVLKVADGATAYCKTQEDVKTGILGAYRAKATSVSYLPKTDQIRIQLGITFLRCKKVSGGYRFGLQKPHSKVSFASNVTPTETQITTVLPREVFVQSSVNGKDILLQDQLLSQAEIQYFPLDYGLEDLLSDEELGQLEQGETIRASADIWIKKSVEWPYVVEKSNLYDVNYGQFRVWFELEPQGFDVKVIAYAIE